MNWDSQSTQSTLDMNIYEFWYFLHELGILSLTDQEF